MNTSVSGFGKRRSWQAWHVRSVRIGCGVCRRAVLKAPFCKVIFREDAFDAFRAEICLQSDP